MIKALMLIFEPATTWEKIVLVKRGFLSLFAGYLLPMLVLSIAAELAGLLYLGKRQEISGNIVPISHNLALNYGVGQFVLSLVVVFIMAKLIKSCGETFHSRHNYGQCFLISVYALAPVFLLRMMDAFPWMNPWVSLGIGVILAWPVLYHGIPRVLMPDPPHAFGLYVTSGVLLSVVVGLARFVSLLLLSGKWTFIKSTFPS